LQPTKQMPSGDAAGVAGVLVGAMVEVATTEAGAATTEVGTIIIGGSQYRPISLFIFLKQINNTVTRGGE